MRRLRTAGCISISRVASVDALAVQLHIRVAHPRRQSVAGSINVRLLRVTTCHAPKLRLRAMRACIRHTARTASL